MTRRAMDNEGPDSSARHFINVVPSDSANLPFVTRQIDVLTPGTLEVIPEGSTVSIILPAAPGAWSFPIRVSRIKATGTTATNIVCYF